LVANAWPTEAQRLHVEDFFHYDDSGFYEGDQLIIPMSAVHIPGLHNRENIELVLGVMKVLGLPYSAVTEALESFAGLPHRLEFVATVNGIEFVDDAIATNPEATLAALAVHGDRLGTIFLGGVDRGLDFEKLVRRLSELKLDGVVFFPDSGVRMLQTWRDLGLPLPTFIETRDMGEAVNFAFEKTPAGKVCLLSTASPSQSIWKDYVEKGTLFKQFVKAKMAL
jgi:UDP-N-acetylmuramoylalanine--D-glutamate ligase